MRTNFKILADDSELYCICNSKNETTCVGLTQSGFFLIFFFHGGETKDMASEREDVQSFYEASKSCRANTRRL